MEVNGMDRILTIPEAAREVPTGPVSPHAVWRWMAVGLRAPNGQRVHLRRLKVGPRFCTTPRLMREFFEAAGSAEPVLEAAGMHQAGGKEHGSGSTAAKSGA